MVANPVTRYPMRDQEATHNRGEANLILTRRPSPALSRVTDASRNS